MTNDRPYRAAHSIEHALDEIDKAAGTQFDPAVADAFITMIRAGRPRFAGISDPDARRSETASLETSFELGS